MEILLRPEHVAEMLGITINTLAAWRINKNRNLKYIKIGKIIRYRKEDVEAFIEQQTIES